MSVQGISQEITPNEIKNKEFKKTMMGYSPEQVVEFLEKVSKVWERVQKQEKEYLKRIDDLEYVIAEYQAKEDEVRQIRDMAQNDADAIRKEAGKEGERILKEVEERAQNIKVKTEEWLAEVIARVEETEQRKQNFMRAFRSALDSHYELLQKDQDSKEPISIQLDQFLKSNLVSGNESRM